MSQVKVEFFLAEFRSDAPSGPVAVPDVLHLKLSRPSLGKSGAPDHEFCDRAKREHVERYRDAFKKFRKSHPEWVCPAGWEDLDFRAEPAPVAENVSKEEPENEAA